MHRLIIPLKHHPKQLHCTRCSPLLRVASYSSSTESSSNDKKEQTTSEEPDHSKNYQFQQQLNEIKIREVNSDSRFTSYRGFTLAKLKKSSIKQVVAKPAIRKALKRGSFVRTLFSPTGEHGIDTDYLYFPEILKSRHQFKGLLEQQQIVEKYFASGVMGQGQEFNTEDVLNRLFDQGYNSLWTLSKVEMMNIIESIGAALATKVMDLGSPISSVPATTIDSQLRREVISTEKPVQLQPLQTDQFWLPSETLVKSDVQLQTYADHALVKQDELRTIIKLLNTQIALSVIDNSPNRHARSLIYDELNQNPHLKIALAYTEPDLRPGQLPCYEFKTNASLLVDKQHWLLSGVKDNILDDDYDYYLVFACNTDYPDSALRPEYLKDQPVPFPGMTALLVKRNEIAQMRQYTKNNMNYQEVRIDELLVNRACREICESVVDGVQAMNAKGLLQLAYSSLILGQMKSLVSECHKFVIDKKTPLISSQYMASLFYQANVAIYKLESLIYYSASLHDGLYKKGYPELSLESSITAVSAVQLGLQCTQAVRKIGGIEVWHKLGPIEDVIVLLGNLVEDNNFSRTQVALYGMDYFAETTGRSALALAKMPMSPYNHIDHPMKPVMKAWGMWKRTLLMYPPHFIGDWDLKGYIHPSLDREGNTLEHSIRLLRYSTSLIYGVNSGELDRIRFKFTFLLYPLYDQASDVFTNIACIARASRAYSETLRNSDVDIFFLRYLTYETLDRSLARLQKLEFEVLDTHKACVDVNHQWSCKNEDDAWYITPAWDNLTKETRESVIGPIDPKKLVTPYKRIE